jgi:hypothetical protein
MMNIEWPWKRKKITLENDLNTFEASLEAIFRPVSPRPEFVKALRMDLIGKPKRRWLGMPEQNWQRGLVVAGGLVSFLAMVIGGIKIVMALLGMKEGNKNRMKKPATA